MIDYSLHPSAHVGLWLLPSEKPVHFAFVNCQNLNNVNAIFKYSSITEYISKNEGQEKKKKKA